MRDTNQHDDDDIDRAYRAAVAAAEDSAAVQRRKRAALQAVGNLDKAGAIDGEGPGYSPVDVLADAPADAPATAKPADRRAANEAHWRPASAWGRGAVAACVIASSVLVVTKLQDEPGTAMVPGERSAPAPGTAADAAPSATSPTTAPTAQMMPAPATPAPAPAAARIVQAKPQVQARRSAFPSVEGEAAGPAGQLERSASADAARSDRSSGSLALSPPVPAALPTAGDAQLQESAPRRTEQALPAARQARAAADSSPAAMAAAPVAPTAQAAGLAGSSSPARGGVASLARSALTAPSIGLLAAVRNGEMAAAQQILGTTDTDPDAERDADGRTALAIAVLRADLPLVKLLLAHRANRLLPDRFGQTPQSYAETSGDPALRKAFGRP